MIGYHPALDPTHAAFRIVRLFCMERGRMWERDRLRIADFFLLFPAAIPTMRLPRGQVRWRAVFQHRSNRYWRSGHPKAHFDRVRPFHDAGTRLLLGVGAIRVRDVAGHTMTEFVVDRLPPGLLRRAQKRNSEDSEFTDFVRQVILVEELTGASGLKDRTGLLEFRYDPV